MNKYKNQGFQLYFSVFKTVLRFKSAMKMTFLEVMKLDIFSHTQSPTKSGWNQEKSAEKIS